MNDRAYNDGLRDGQLTKRRKAATTTIADIGMEDVKVAYDRAYDRGLKDGKAAKKGDTEDAKQAYILGFYSGLGP